MMDKIVTDIIEAMAQTVENGNNAAFCFPNRESAAACYYAIKATAAFVSEDGDDVPGNEVEWDNDNLIVRVRKIDWEAHFCIEPPEDSSVKGFHTLGEDDELVCRDLADVDAAFMAAVMDDENIVLVFKDKTTAIKAFMQKEVRLFTVAKLADEMESYRAMNPNEDTLTFGGNDCGFSVMYRAAEDVREFVDLDAIIVDCTEVG